MKKSDQYHRWVTWSEEDQTYLGMCPDLINPIHDDNPIRLYKDLCDLIDEEVEEREAEGRPLPTPAYQPMQVELKQAA